MSESVQETRPRRRWFRFSLRTLLVLVVVVAIPLAWIAKERRHSNYEQRVADQLQNQRTALVEFGGLYDSFDLWAQDKPQGWWRRLARQVLGERIWTIEFQGEYFNDLTLLAGLTNVRWLWINSSDVTDFTPLKGIKSLRRLDLAHTKVTDVTPLAGLTNLEYVELRRSPITKEQVEALQKALPNCEIKHDPFP